jgi:hypothetical protein
LNLRPLGYETNDNRLRRPAQSLVTALASANLRQQVSRDFACLPHLTASRPVRFTNPFTDPVPWPALIPPTTLAHRLIIPHHRASLTPEIPVGSTRLASPRRDGPRRITQGQSDGVSHQSRAPRAQGPVPQRHPHQQEGHRPPQKAIVRWTRTQCHSNRTPTLRDGQVRRWKPRLRADHPVL